MIGTWATVFLGVIAVATLGTAVFQVLMAVHAGRVARRVEHLVEGVERDLKPLLEHANAVGRDAARVSALAVAQAERAGEVCEDIGDRLTETVSAVQRSVLGPARDGLAILTALRAIVEALRGPAKSRRASDEDEALFI